MHKPDLCHFILRIRSSALTRYEVKREKELGVSKDIKKQHRVRVLLGGDGEYNSIIEMGLLFIIP